MNIFSNCDMDSNYSPMFGLFYEIFFLFYWQKAKFMNVVGFHIVEGFPLPNAINSEDKSEYIFDVSTFDKISSSPLLRDPYEAICVACKKSKVQKIWVLT